MMAIAACFSGGFILLSALLKPKKKDASEQTIYECGVSTPLQNARERFSVKFFLVAMLFILFDIEGVFLVPWAVLFKDFLRAGQGGLVLTEGLVFVTILGIGLGYVWKKGALNWR